MHPVLDGILMKFCLKILIPAMFALLCLQCCENGEDPDVKVFVLQIQSGRYTYKSPLGYSEVPAFKKNDISTLLFYAQDHTPVKDFPVNPISSARDGDFRLSQCLLWTIEKIRFGNYPSLTPALMKKDSLTGKYNIVTNPEDIDEVWELYNKWWQAVENQPVNSSPDHYTVNPLQGTAYLWY